MTSSPHARLWLGAWLALGVMLLLPPSGRALAQAVAEQLATCKRENGSTPARIAACSWIVDNAKDNEDLRAEAHLQRGVLLELAGDKEAALKDYSEAIA